MDFEMPKSPIYQLFQTEYLYSEYLYYNRFISTMQLTFLNKLSLFIAIFLSYLISIISGFSYGGLILLIPFVQRIPLKCDKQFCKTGPEKYDV
ncbi:MAG TPA: hypothetical protein DCK76_12050 [Desulfotomaculum sp.]|nr:hypothetical protein [Desulfotomaculum sp.]